MLFFLCLPAMAQDPNEVTPLEAAAEGIQTNINIVWTCIAAFLVFFMQAGFAMVEAGFTRAKNAVNIIMKNLMDFSVGTVAFALVGFGLMFGASNGLFGTTHFGLSDMGDDMSWNDTGRPVAVNGIVAASDTGSTSLTGTTLLISVSLSIDSLVLPGLIEDFMRTKKTKQWSNHIEVHAY